MILNVYVPETSGSFKVMKVYACRQVPEIMLWFARGFSAISVVECILSNGSNKHKRYRGRDYINLDFSTGKSIEIDDIGITDHNVIHKTKWEF